MVLLPVLLVAGGIYAAKSLFNQSQAVKGIDYNFTGVKLNKVTPKIIPPSLSLNLQLLFDIINPTNVTGKIEQLFLQIYAWQTIKLGEIVSKDLPNGTVEANDKSEVSIPFDFKVSLTDIKPIIKAAKAQDSSIDVDENESRWAKIFDFLKTYVPKEVKVKGTIKVNGIVKYIDETINFSE